MQKKYFFQLIACLFSLFTYAQRFEEVQIGSQIWMSKNLDVGQFRNGEFIMEAKTDEEWRTAIVNKQPAWCYYNNNPSYGSIYGKIYNYYAVYDLRGLSPDGWRIPKSEDWTRLTDYLGSINVASKKMKSSNGWEYNGNGDNSSGFSAKPGGYRSSYGAFMEVGHFTKIWARLDDLDEHGLPILKADEIVWYDRPNVEMGYSVRCIKDTVPNQSQLFDQTKYKLAKLQLVPGQDFDFYFNTAWYYVNKEGEGSYSAVVNFEEAIKLNPNKGGVYSDLGNCYRGGFKWYTKAEECYALSIVNWYREGYVYYNRAICRSELNDIRGMKKDLRVAKNNGWPYDPSNLYNKFN